MNFNGNFMPTCDGMNTMNHGNNCGCGCCQLPAACPTYTCCNNTVNKCTVQDFPHYSNYHTNVVNTHIRRHVNIPQYTTTETEQFVDQFVQEQPVYYPTQYIAQPMPQPMPMPYPMNTVPFDQTNTVPFITQGVPFNQMGTNTVPFNQPNVPYTGNVPFTGTTPFSF